MIIWIPRSRGLAAKGMISNLLTKSQYGKVLATHTHEGDTVAAVVDGKVPRKSSDQSCPRWTSLPFNNSRQDISFEFAEPKKVSSVSVYWYEDAEDGKVRLPREWWVDYKAEGGEWTRMKKYFTDFYGLEKDAFNYVRLAAALNCDAIRISILPQVGYCMGIHEIQLGLE